MAVFNIRAILFVAVLWTAVHKTNNSCHALVAIRPLSSWRLSVPMPRQNHATAETQRHFRQSPRLLPLSVVPLQLSSLVVDAVTATNTVAAANTEMSPLLLYFWQTVIANGIPAAFALLVIGFTAKQFRSNSSTGRRGDSTNGDSTGSVVAAQQLYDDLYGDQDPDPFDPQRPRRRTGGFGSWLGGDNNTNKNRLPQNTGVPLSQYLQLTHVNKKYDSYQYSMTAATQTKAQAAAQYRTAAWNRAFSSSIGSSLSTTDAMNSTTTTNIATALAPSKRQELQTLEQEYLKQSALKQQEWQSLQTKLQQLAMDETMEKTLGMKSVYQLDPAAVGEKDSSTQNKTATELETSNNNIFANLGRNPSNNNKSKKKQSLLSAMSALQTSLASLETDFFQKVLVVVGPTHAAAVRTAILGRDGGFPTGAAGGVRPFFPALADESMTGRVFVTRFPGDATASQVATLREEVTALVQNGRSGVDRVVVVLQTGGGTVTGYGLAAAQLMRLKDAGLHLTIAVEQVAASGGYMMACIADRIVASPFAVLGSIGVISDIPNVYNRLKQEGIEFQTVTAGKYKRTLTPTKKVTSEDFQKTKQDVENIFNLFRDFVATNRPQLDIEKVATGETWFGTAALELNLCDEIKTVDDVVMDYIQAGHDVYEIKYKPPSVGIGLGQLLQPMENSSSQETGPLSSLVRWLVRTVASSVVSEMNESASLRGAVKSMDKPIQERYMALDDTADRVRSQD